MSLNSILIKIIYYIINLDIILFFMGFSNLFMGPIYYIFGLIKLFFLKKWKRVCHRRRKK